MNRLLIGIFAAGLGAATVAGVHVVRPGWTEKFGQSVSESVPTGVADTTPERESTELDSNRHDLQRRMEQKRRIADDVLAGRMAFRSAAVAFRTLNDNSKYVLPVLHVHNRDASVDELHCRNLISYVVDRVPSALKRACVLAALEAELQQLRLEGGGRVRLPEAE